MKYLTLIFFIFSLTISAQDYSNNKVVPLSVVIAKEPATITLNWTENTSNGDTYIIKRKLKGENAWNLISTVGVGTKSYTDNSISIGVSYEYSVEKVIEISSYYVYSWGYINAGIDVELDYNKGDLLLLVESNLAISLPSEMAQLKEDLYKDGWMVTVLNVSKLLSAVEVKEQIQQYYESLPNLQTLYILGHVAVPYSGNINPDGHGDHRGAWPADVYYADLDGDWTDISVNNSSASDKRNHNIPSDGKFDQSFVPSKLELEVCRVDLSNMNIFSFEDVSLTKKYLDKAHNFKAAKYKPEERGMYDDGFTWMTEGFAQNAIRNFAPFFGANNVQSADYYNSLTQGSYLWSYGCGPGSNFSIDNLKNNSALTTFDLKATEMEAVFTMVFGSYFGDWDQYNNVMRAILINGKTLAVSWAGRPNMQYHTMALGESLGSSAKMSMDKNSGYNNGGIVGNEMVHVSQLGDPSLRTYYVRPPSELSVIENINDNYISWTASADLHLNGYNVYRRTETSLWEKLTLSFITPTSFVDNTITSDLEYEYMVKAVSLKTNGSGSFFNESLGTIESEILDVEDNEIINVSIFPNPTSSFLNITSINTITQIRILSTSGQVIKDIDVCSKETCLSVSSLINGVYIISIETGKGILYNKFIKN